MPVKLMNIQIRGAREHNLQGVDVAIGDGLTVITGVSGSGKTSLAFDTLYHEARRRFLDVFSLHRQACACPLPTSTAISGLGPAIAVGQNLLNRNPNSTLATASGLHPFLRLLYTNFGERHCPHCGAGLAVLSPDEIVERLVLLAAGAPVSVSGFRWCGGRPAAMAHCLLCCNRSLEPLVCALTATSGRPAALILAARA